MSVSRHTGYNLVGQVIPLVVSLATVPVYLRLVGPDRYGVLAIAWLLLGYFGFFDLGRATSFRIASLKSASAEARASTFWAATIVNIALGGVGGLMLWAVASQFFSHIFKVSEGLRPEILAAVPLLAAAVPVAALNGVLTGAVQGRERFLEINVISTLSTMVFQLLPLAVTWLFGPNLVWLLACVLLARLLSAAMLAYRCHLDLTRGQPIRTDRKEIVTLLKYGGWVNLSAIFGPVLYMVDRFVIGAVLGASAVTSYTVPVQQLAGRTAILSYALTQALFPKLSSADPARQREIFDQALLSFASLLSLPFLGAIYVVGPFIHLWIGDRLGPEAPFIARLMIAAMWTNGLALISFTQLEAAGRPDLVTRVQVAEIAPYLALLYFGMHYLGLTGAAFAAAIRYVADFFILTAVAGAPAKGKGVLGANLVLLFLGVWISGLWPITDWRWWGSAALLGSGVFALGVFTLPQPTRVQIQAMAGRLLVRR